jgi:hypothetical protein
MLSWFLNPWMLLGGLAIASPILIHLLNKRRFKIVDWAAMDFLFQADKKNRRRVELENFILLALRCLAMLLLAFLLARPLLPSSITQLVQQAEKYERIILIDDSLSQRVLNSHLPALDGTKASISQLLTSLATSEESENWLTVMLTSRPEAPILSNEPLTANTLATLLQTINAISCTDTVADYPEALSELNRYLKGQRENIGRVVYFYSDLRERDWVQTVAASEESAPNNLMNEIANTALDCFLIDIGSPDDQNLAVVSIRPDGLLLNDRPIRFFVSVTNFGSQTAENVRVLLQLDQGQPRFEMVPSIAPGQTQEVSFLHLFPSERRENLPIDFGSEEQPTSSFRFHRIRAEIDRQSLGENGLIQDQLQEDSSGLFAAKVRDGIPVLLVDGDPSSISERSETHYLRSLQVPGTGLRMTNVTISEFETIPLSQFQVIFLCNIDEASRDRVESLRDWVQQGGGLVIMPGNRVRAAAFNSAFYQSGEGLSPLALTQVSGSATMNQWVNFDLSLQVHPALRVIVDSDVSSLFNVDIFSWWSVAIDEQKMGKTVSVPLRLTDENNSPAMVERTLGDGKVVVFSIPADGDWTLWPSSPTFAPVMIDLIDYLIGNEFSISNLQVGNPIHLPVDLAVHENRVSLRDPDNEKVEAVARPIRRGPPKGENVDQNPDAEADGNSASPLSDHEGLANDFAAEPGRVEESSETAEVAHGVQFENTGKRGFYQSELRRHNGDVDTVLFAVNYDPRESRLTRLSNATLDGNFFSDKVRRMTPGELNKQSVTRGNSEIWPSLLVVLFGILVSEQFLAWWWGRKR